MGGLPKVIALFALGTSYQDIRTHIADLYGMSLSNGTLVSYPVKWTVQK